MTDCKNMICASPCLPQNSRYVWFSAIKKSHEILQNIASFKASIVDFAMVSAPGTHTLGPANANANMSNAPQSVPPLLAAALGFFFRSLPAFAWNKRAHLPLVITLNSKSMHPFQVETKPPKEWTMKHFQLPTVGLYLPGIERTSTDKLKKWTRLSTGQSSPMSLTWSPWKWAKILIWNALKCT